MMRRRRPSGLKKPRPLRRQTSSGSTESTESFSDEPTESKIEGTTETKSCAVFTLKDENGEMMVLTGQNVNSMLNAYNILVRSGGFKLVTMEMMCDLEVKPDHVPSSTCHDTKSDSEDHKEATTPKTNVSYSKQELIKLSQSKLCQTQPPLWNLLTHTHAPCCLPPDQVNYFHPSNFQEHDGTYVVE